LQIDACIWYFLRTDPDGMSDEQWARAAKMIEWVRQEELKNSLNRLKGLL